MIFIACLSIGHTFLHKSCLHGNYSLSKLFISKGADVNIRTYTHKHTPLHLAAQYNHSEIVRLLISRGAEIQARDINGCTPLHYTATNGHTDSAVVLMDSGADPNETNLKNNIPLHNAAKWGHVVMVQCLLSNGSVVDTHNDGNLLPIQVCVTCHTVIHSSAVMYEVGHVNNGRMTAIQVDCNIPNVAVITGLLFCVDYSVR